MGSYEKFNTPTLKSFKGPRQINLLVNSQRYGVDLHKKAERLSLGADDRVLHLNNVLYLQILTLARTLSKGFDPYYLKIV